MLVYYRSVDIASHNAWKFFAPDAFAGLDPAELAARRDEVPRAYEAVDRAVGEIVAAAGPEANVFVLSDHGFRPANPERVQILLDLDELLVQLGYLVRTADGVDFARSELYTYASPRRWTAKQVRFALAGREPGGRVRPSERAAVRRRLEADLARVAYASGAPVFRVRDVRSRDRPAGGDFVVQVLTEAPTREILVAGRPLPGVVVDLVTISGTHSRNTHGILIAAGPDVAPGADLEGIGVLDATPTLLYGLGLPVARDFDGRAWPELYSQRFRATRPLRSIASWGAGAGAGPLPSAVDEEILDELRALGYIE